MQGLTVAVTTVIRLTRPPPKSDTSLYWIRPWFIGNPLTSYDWCMPSRDSCGYM